MLGEARFVSSNDKSLIVLARYNSTFFDDKYTGLVESHFENNPKQLEWVIHYQDGKIVKHEGYYANDKKNGQGTYKWADGRYYIGGWNNGK